MFLQEKALPRPLLADRKDVPAAASRRGMHTQGLVVCDPGRKERHDVETDGSAGNAGQPWPGGPSLRSKPKTTRRTADLAGKGSRNHERCPNRGGCLTCHRGTHSGVRKRLYVPSLVACGATITACPGRLGPGLPVTVDTWQAMTVVSCRASFRGHDDAIRRMTTENRAIRIGGVVDDILAGGVEIKSHRRTSCGLAAVAQETGQTNIRSTVYTGNGFMQSIPTAPDAERIRRFARFAEISEKRGRRTPGSGTV